MSARLALSLLRQAVVTFSVIPPSARTLDAAFASIDDFVAGPSPSRYLAAARALREARRDRALSLLRKGSAARSFEKGLDLVRALLDDATADILSALPIDERAGQRLRALACLCATKRELAERVAGQAEAMRKQLAFEIVPPPAHALRRIVRKTARAARQSKNQSRKKRDKKEKADKTDK